jgi:hypothetical protein
MSDPLRTLEGADQFGRLPRACTRANANGTSSAGGSIGLLAMVVSFPVAALPIPSPDDASVL